MQKRRDLYNKLSEKHKKFIEDYLKNNLKLSKEKWEEFLFPEYEKHLQDYSKMKSIQKGVDRFISALENNEKICIYGDYDCDGVPGVALFRDFLEKINYNNVIYYIPHRHHEGYGLHTEAIKKLHDEKVKLIVTIDLGITNIKEIDFANTLNIDVIVTDHHLPIEDDNGQILPKAYAIINNKQAGCEYNFKELCGSGTVWKFISAIIENKNFQEKYKLQKGYEKWLLDMVGIATISDLVPLVGENRVLSIYGMHVLTQTKRAGLKKIFAKNNVDLSRINETDIAFTLAPRINAASRMAHPKVALKMLSTNLTESLEGAEELENLNKERKESVASIMKKVHKMMDERILNNTLHKILVVGDRDWGAGILGLIASQIVEKYNVNAFVYGGEEKEIFKGSCRSNGEAHVVKLMTDAANLFTHFGGHEMSGGFAIELKNIFELEKTLNEIYAKDKKAHIEKKEERGDENILKIFLEEVDYKILNTLSLLAPFGVGNAIPSFRIENLKDIKSERFGKNKEHLKLILKAGEEKITIREAIKFFCDEKLENEILNINWGELKFQIEAGFRSNIPRLKIVI